MSSNAETWPELPYGAWKDTCATLQLWTQIVGKIRLVQTPCAESPVGLLLPRPQGLGPVR